MPKYEVSQNFNNGKARKFQTMDTDATTLTALIALMPKGQTVFEPSATGAVGTPRAVPTSYVEALVSCYDRTDGKYNANYVGVKFGKATLSDDDIVTACLSKVEVPNGSVCDNVSISKFKMV